MADAFGLQLEDSRLPLADIPVCDLPWGFGLREVEATRISYGVRSPVGNDLGDGRTCACCGGSSAWA